MKKLTILLLCLAGLSLVGCNKAGTHSPASSRIVTGIDVYCQKPHGQLKRHYRQPEKVKAVLHYIRLLNPNGPTPVSQEAMQGDFYEIVVHLHDGGMRIHRQRADTFAALHRRYWGRIDRSLGMQLARILALLPGD